MTISKDQLLSTERNVSPKSAIQSARNFARQFKEDTTVLKLIKHLKSPKSQRYYALGVGFVLRNVLIRLSLSSTYLLLQKLKLLIDTGLTCLSSTDYPPQKPDKFQDQLALMVLESPQLLKFFQGTLSQIQETLRILQSGLRFLIGIEDQNSKTISQDSLKKT